MDRGSWVVDRLSVSSGIGLCLFVLLLVAACGSEPEGPAIPDLDGERRAEDTRRPGRSSALDLSRAPSEAHRVLAGYLPTDALQRDTVEFAGWDGTASVLNDLNPARAPIPAVYAEYLSTSMRIVEGEDPKGREVKLNQPQRCGLTLIRCPDPTAATVVERNLIEKLGERGFVRRDSLELVFGADDGYSIRRFVRIDHDDEYDDVLVAYLNVVGDIVIYGLETERVNHIAGPDDARVSIVTDDSRGSRVGAQVLALALHKITDR